MRLGEKCPQTSPQIVVPHHIPKSGHMFASVAAAPGTLFARLPFLKPIRDCPCDCNRGRHSVVRAAAQHMVAAASPSGKAAPQAAKEMNAFLEASAQAALDALHHLGSQSELHKVFSSFLLDAKNACAELSDLKYGLTTTTKTREQLQERDSQWKFKIQIPRSWTRRKRSPS